MKEPQFFTLPSKMTEGSNLKPTDVLIYLYLKCYDNKEHKCYPSLSTLSKRSKAAVNTIKKAINNLVLAGYIDVKKIGRSNYYFFKKTIKFDKFYLSFIDNTDLTFKEKAYIACIYQYMYKDIAPYGKLSFTNKDLADLINVSEDGVYRLNKSLVRKKVLQILKESKRNLETGCPEELKLFDLQKCGQAALWLIQDNCERIEELERKDKEKDKIIKMLKEEINSLKEKAEKSLEIVL
jgi:DNA-binding MarR family transcriptional regulator